MPWQVQKASNGLDPSKFSCFGFLVLLLQPQDYGNGMESQARRSPFKTGVLQLPLTSHHQSHCLSTQIDADLSLELTRPSRASGCTSTFPTILTSSADVHCAGGGVCERDSWGACRALYTLQSVDVVEAAVHCQNCDSRLFSFSGKSSFFSGNQVGMWVRPTFLPYQGVGQVVSKGSILPAIMWEVSGPLNAEFLVTSVRMQPKPRPKASSQLISRDPYMRWPAKQPSRPTNLASCQKGICHSLSKMKKQQRERRGNREKGLV